MIVFGKLSFSPSRDFHFRVWRSIQLHDYEFHTNSTPSRTTISVQLIVSHCSSIFSTGLYIRNCRRIPSSAFSSPWEDGIFIGSNHKMWIFHFRIRRVISSLTILKYAYPFKQGFNERQCLCFAMILCLIAFLQVWWSIHKGKFEVIHRGIKDNQFPWQAAENVLYVQT